MVRATRLRAVCNCCMDYTLHSSRFRKPLPSVSYPSKRVRACWRFQCVHMSFPRPSCQTVGDGVDSAAATGMGLGSRCTPLHSSPAGGQRRSSGRASRMRR